MSFASVIRPPLDFVARPRARSGPVR
jgi:hypothetical protein